MICEINITHRSVVGIKYFVGDFEKLILKVNWRGFVQKGMPQGLTDLHPIERLLLQAFPDKLLTFLTSVHILGELDLLGDHLVHVAFTPNAKWAPPNKQLVHHQPSRPNVHWWPIQFLLYHFRRYIQRSSAIRFTKVGVITISGPTEIADFWHPELEDNILWLYVSVDITHSMHESETIT